MSVAPAISVLVASATDAPALREVLRIIARQATPLRAERVLVINASPGSLSTPSQKALAALCDRLIFEAEPGKSRALNRGIEACRGEVVVFTDDDVVPGENWLHAISAPLLERDRDPHLMACGGPVVPTYDPEVPLWFRRLVGAKASNFLGPRHEWGPDAFDYAVGENKRGGVPIGANAAFRREVFAEERYDPELGPNRATGFRGGEDSALARRLLERGYRIRYVPGARVEHPVSPERSRLDAVREAHYIRGRERVMLARKLALPLPARGYVWRKMIWNRMKTPVVRTMTGNPHPPEEFRWRYHRGMLRELGTPPSKDV